MKSRIVVGAIVAVMVVLLIGLEARVNKTSKAVSELTSTVALLSNRCDQLAAVKVDVRMLDQVLTIYNMRLSIAELAAKYEVGDKRWNKYVGQVVEAVKVEQQRRAQANAKAAADSSNTAVVSNNVEAVETKEKK